MLVTTAFLLASAAASTTLLGWLVATTGRMWHPRMLGMTLLLAGTAMLAISSLQLIPTSLASGLATTAVAIWAVSGALIVVVMGLLARLLKGSSPLARGAVLVAVAIGLHNIPEGAATASAALLSVRSGIVTAIAVGLHNIPEGMAVATTAIAGGGSRTRAFWYTCVATAGEVLGAVLALAYSESLTDDRTAGLLALVAGIMITLSLVELLPSGWSLLRRYPASRSSTR